MRAAASYWEKTAWKQSPDLLIVGGGIVGASTALFYKEKYPDRDVLIVERGEIPEGASTRNAGFACIGSMSEHLADMEISGKETVLNRIERRWRGLQLLRNTLGDEAIGYEPVGGREIFTDEELYDTCRGRITELNKQLADRLGEKEIYSITEIGGLSAIKNRVEGALHSGKLMRSLHQKIAEKGVRVWWNKSIDSVKPGSVTLSDGEEIQADKIVLATNGFTSGLTDTTIKPARGYLFVSKPIENLPWCGTFHYNKGYIYFRNVGDCLMLGGARDLDKERETTSEFGVNKTIKNHLVEFANGVLNLPEDWEIEMEWSGIMGMTPDKEPIIKPVDENVWMAAGLSGMGIAIGMDVAKKVVEKL